MAFQEVGDYAETLKRVKHNRRRPAIATKKMLRADHSARSSEREGLGGACARNFRETVLGKPGSGPTKSGAVYARAEKRQAVLKDRTDIVRLNMAEITPP